MIMYFSYSKIINQNLQFSLLLNPYQICLAKSYKKATADIQERDFEGKWVQRGTNINGIIQENGNFIFYIDDEYIRMLVLSTNTGFFIKYGTLPVRAIQKKKLEEASKSYWKWRNIVSSEFRITNIDVGGEKHFNHSNTFSEIQDGKYHYSNAFNWRHQCARQRTLQFLLQTAGPSFTR